MIIVVFCRVASLCTIKYAAGSQFWLVTLLFLLIRLPSHKSSLGATALGVLIGLDLQIFMSLYIETNVLFMTMTSRNKIERRNIFLLLSFTCETRHLICFYSWAI